MEALPVQTMSVQEGKILIRLGYWLRCGNILRNLVTPADNPIF